MNYTIIVKFIFQGDKYLNIFKNLSGRIQGVRNLENRYTGKNTTIVIVSDLFDKVIKRLSEILCQFNKTRKFYIRYVLYGFVSYINTSWNIQFGGDFHLSIKGASYVSRKNENPVFTQRLADRVVSK